MRPILVGFDGSEYGWAALRFAMDEARLRGTGLRMLYAREYPAESWGEFPVLEEVLKRYQEHAEELVAGAVAAIEKEAGDVKVEALAVEGRPGHAILESASDAMMIVIGSHGLGRITGLFLGSVSQEVVSKASVPVIVVPKPDSTE